jgi:TetR/AcrR family transcriptional regulator, mexJK operon transcriptional repressor
MTPAPDTAEPGRSARKREAILDAARTVFLRKGYGGASMDEVAALAAVSKQTVYKHFADKRGLFTAIVTGDIETAETLTHDMVAALPETEDVEKDLRAFARRHVADVTQPHLVRLRRLVIAEAERFPEVAQTWYASGPERAHAVLAEQFRKLGRRGMLRVDDPLLAAQHFNWLILSIPLNAAMLNGEGTTFSRRQLNRFADEGVRVFLAAYGTGERERSTHA